MLRFKNEILLFHFINYRDLLNLDKLDLADNKLSTVPSSAMMPIPQLRELQLSNNQITSLKNFTFIYLTALIKLGKYFNESTQYLVMFFKFQNESENGNWLIFFFNFRQRIKWVWSWGHWGTSIFWTWQFEMAEAWQK